MSVLKNKRKASQFEVFHHLYKVRKEITELLLGISDIPMRKRKSVC